MRSVAIDRVHPMKRLLRLPHAGGAIAVVLALGGCVDFAPHYERPAAPVAAGWPVAVAASAPAPAPAAAGEPGDLGWREVLRDDRLRRVVEMALAESRDLRATLLQVDNARAQYRLQEATALPSVSGTAGVTRTGVFDGAAANSASVSVGVSSYELDLFGRVRNANDKALQSYLSSVEGARSARLALVAAVATQWLALAADAERQRVNERQLALETRSLDLNRRMHDLGAIKGLPVVQAQASVESARGTVAAMRTTLLQDRNALALLVGREVPEELLPVEAMPATAAVLVDVPAGLPAQVLQRRPDVLDAEHSLQAAQIDIGIARAAFFPTISLTASAGSASTGLSGLFKAGSNTWSFGPSVSLPIFDGGRNQAGLDSAKVLRDIALANYDKAVQTAFREVADALAARSTLAERVATQRAQTQASAAALRDADALYRAGQTSYLEVLTAQRTYYASQQSEVTLALEEQDNRITLYKVLGGGWRESN
jgi:multidrug efflux system outer membrane protein